MQLQLWVGSVITSLFDLIARIERPNTIMICNEIVILFWFVYWHNFCQVSVSVSAFV